MWNHKNHFRNRSNKHFEVVKILLEHGAKFNIPDGNCDTPLHMAAQNDNTKVEELLLQNKADVNATNNDGDSVLDVAAQHCKGILTKYGAMSGNQLRATNQQ